MMEEPSLWQITLEDAEEKTHRANVIASDVSKALDKFMSDYEEKWLGPLHSVLLVRFEEQVIT